MPLSGIYSSSFFWPVGLNRLAIIYEPRPKYPSPPGLLDQLRSILFNRLANNHRGNRVQAKCK